MNKILFTILLLWPFIWSNSQNVKLSPLSISLIPLPDYFTIVPILISFLILIQFTLNRITLNRNINYYTIRKEIYLYYFIFGISFISLLFYATYGHDNGLNSQYFESFLKYFRPILLFISVYLIYNPKIMSLSYVKKIIFIPLIIFVSVAWLQILIFGSRIDAVTGLSKSAHTFVIESAIGISYFLVLLSSKLGLKYCFMLLFFLIPVVFASFGQGFLTLIVAIVIYWLIGLEKKSIVRFLKHLLLLVVSFTIILFLVSNYDYSTFSKILILKEIDYQNIPIVRSIMTIPKFLSESLSNVLIGFGPGHFGSESSYAAGTHQMASTTMFNKIYSYIGITGFYGSMGLTPQMIKPLNGILVVLYENGLVVVILYIIFLFKVLRKIIVNINERREVVFGGAIFILYLMWLIFAFTMPSSKAFENTSFTLPIMLSAIYIKRCDEKSRRNIEQ